MDANFPDEMLGSIETFFRDVHPTLEPGRDVYPEVFDTPLFFPLQRQRELARMMQIARSVSPRVVMEIGADKGGGLYHWCQCLPSVEKVIGCEIRGTPYSTLFETAFPRLRFRWCPDGSRSVKTIGAIATFLCGEPVDCLFIDGDKKMMAEDFYAYLPLMRSGGVVFIHDVQDDHPYQAFNRIALTGKFRTEIIVDKSEAFEALERRKAGEVVTSAWDGWLKQWAGYSCGVGVIYIP